MTRPKPNSSREKAKRAQLSCFTCRARKVKCDRLLPCAACAQYQDPGGCRYDMSDDKRQPILMADANKQLQRENMELKAINQERLCENEVLRMENADIKAVMIDLRSRLSPPQQYHPSANKNFHSNQHRDYRHVNSAPCPEGVSAMDWRDMDQRSISRNSDHLNERRCDNETVDDATFAASTTVSADDVKSRAYSQSALLSQASNSADMIVSHCRRMEEPSISILAKSMTDLLSILDTLPEDARFKNSWLKNTTALPLRGIDIQALLFCQIVHGYIIALLSQMARTYKCEVTDQCCIRLPEPFQCQMITSCLEILAVAEGCLQHGDENMLWQTNACYQSFTAASILSCLDPAPCLLPYKANIERMLAVFQESRTLLMESSGTNAFSALTRLLPLTQVQSVSGDQEFLTPTNGSPSNEQPCFRRIPEQSEHIVTAAIVKCEAAPVQDPIVARQFQYGDIQYLQQHEDQSVSESIHWFPSDSMIMNRGQHSLMGPDTRDTPSTSAKHQTYTHHSPCSASNTDSHVAMSMNQRQQPIYSTVNTSPPYQQSYTSSIHTPGSPLDSPAGSQPLTPVPGTVQMAVYGKNQQSWDFSQQVYELETRCWPCNYA